MGQLQGHEVNEFNHCAYRKMHMCLMQAHDISEKKRICNIETLAHWPESTSVCLHMHLHVCERVHAQTHMHLERSCFACMPCV